MPLDSSRSAGGRLALPTCRNYWRLYDNLPKVHSASAVLTSPHGMMSPKYNKSSKRRHHTQLDDLDDETVLSDFRYRIRESLNPTPFRGVAMLTFWLFFGLTLTFIAVMILTLLYVAQDDRSSHINPTDSDTINDNDTIILKTLFHHRPS